MKEEKIILSGNAFSKNILPGLIRKKALEAILSHQHNQVEVVIVTASSEYWLKKWCDEFGILLISTNLLVENGKITGKINGLNCHGIEKVKRIKSLFELHKYENIYCYGDTQGDFPMLKLGTKSHYKPFRGSSILQYLSAL